MTNPVFEPSKPHASGEIGTGASWKEPAPDSSVARISSRDTWQETHAQALTEVVVLLHSIRRILIWTLVIIPLIAAIAVGVLLGVTVGESTSSPYLGY